MEEKKKILRVAMLGHKRIPSQEGGIEVVVEELAARITATGGVSCGMLQPQRTSCERKGI